MLQPRPAASQADDGVQEVRVLETVEPATGRRSLHVREGLSPDEIRAVQWALSRAGFGEPWRDGSLDPFTRGALQRFQTQRGLAVCACVSLETLIELDLKVRVAETIVLEAPSRPRPEAVGREGEDVNGSAGTVSAFIDYGRYYPYSVVFLSPYIHPYYDPHQVVLGAGVGVGATLIGPASAIGRRVRGVPGGASVRPAPVVGPSPAVRGLGPFPRVSPPPNVVRGSG
jgi:hypothetical protein